MVISESVASMPRKLRVEYPGAIYHVMSRANGKGNIFVNDAEGELKARAKCDPAKLALAARLRRETTLGLSWMAERLHLGTRKSFSAKLHRWRKANEKETKSAKTIV